MSLNSRTAIVLGCAGQDGSLISIFILDPYARSSKRGGAWMNAYVPQSKLLNQKPIIANHLNITQDI